MVTIAIPDTRAAVIALLKSDPAVAGVTGGDGGRVFGGRLPNAQVERMPRNGIVISWAGLGSGANGARSYETMQCDRLDVKCYGSDPYEAGKVYRAVRVVLNGLTRRIVGTALLYEAVQTGGPLDLIEQDVDWPLVLGVWDVRASTIEV
jgi:hypothetical protein